MELKRREQSLKIDNSSEKLLILSQCFYPSNNRGGSTISVINLVKSINSDFDVSVITTYYEMGTGKPYTEVSEGKNRIFNCDVYYLENNKLGTVWKQIINIRPSVIYVSSIFSAMHSIPAMLYKKYIDKSVRLIISPRGELMGTALHMKSLKKGIFLKVVKFSGLFKKVEFHVTSEEEKKELKRIFPTSSLHYIKDLSLVEVNKFQRPKKERGTIKIFTTGRVHPIKNLDKAIEILGSIEGDVQFDVYGPKEDIDYFDLCMSRAAGMENKVKVEYKGNIQHDKVPELISNYHLFLSPTKSENFGHSIVEAMQYGCPVVISDRTPWQKLDKFKAGYSIALDHSEEFSKVIQMFIDMNDTEYQQWCVHTEKYIIDALEVQKNIDEYKKMFRGQ